MPESVKGSEVELVNESKDNVDCESTDGCEMKDGEVMMTV